MTMALEGGEGLVSRPGCFFPQERPGTHCIGGWVGLRAGLERCSGSNRIIPLMRRPNTDRTPNKPVTLPRNQLLIRYAVTSPVHTVTICGNVTSVYPPLIFIVTMTATYTMYHMIRAQLFLQSERVSRNRTAMLNCSFGLTKNT
jgi:hypothetical protein